MKGVGIILIVIGHIDTGILRDFLYMFHVTLFFFLSGYLFKNKIDFRNFFLGKFKSLIVPYFAYLCLFTLLMIIKAFVKGDDIEILRLLFFNALFGGKSLTGWFSVFWFISSLFATQLICYFLIKLSIKKLVLVASLFLVSAYIQAFLKPGIAVFWALNTVLYCVPLFISRYLYRRFNIEIRRKFLASIFVICFVFYLVYPALLYTDIKESVYGPPFVSLIISLGFVLCVFEVLKTIKQYQSLNIITNFGIASMTVMYLHQPIQITLRHQIGFKNDILTISITLLTCMLFHFIIKKNNVISKLFNGYN